MQAGIQYLQETASTGKGTKDDFKQYCQLSILPTP